MTVKPQSSTVSLKTLKGVFDQPKMNHRRDFLRENKLSLRELQKNTNQKLTQQKQELENRQYKHIQKFHKSQEQSLPRRSASQSRSNEQNFKKQSRTAVGDDGVGLNDRGGGDNVAIKGSTNNLSGRRAYNQQRHNEDTASTCCCIQPQQSETQYREPIPRSASSVSVLSKVSCNKEIQTEDIHDQDFLYEALKKCSFEVNLQQKQRSESQINMGDNNHQHAQHSNYNNLQQYEAEIKPVNSHERAIHTHVSQCHNEDSKPLYNQISHHSSRFDNNSILNGHNHIQEGEIENGENEDLDQDFRNLKIAADMRREPEAHSSARSRHTLYSISSKKSSHALGSRDDVRLPRYLEKEKREKEEERVRELNKDRNCPDDYYAVSEEERLNVLNKSKQKMAALINELNHMPMTMETLRIRTRKAEIEKELTQIELDIRLYSKSKVYIPKAC